MSENSLIKKMANGILRNRKQSFFDRSIMHPEREWFLGVMGAILILGVGIFWSVTTYLHFSRISITSTGSNDEDVVYRDSLVKTALDDFAARKKSYEQLKQELLGKYQKAGAAIPLLGETQENASSTEVVPSTEVSTTTAPEASVETPELEEETEVGEIKFE